MVLEIAKKITTFLFVLFCLLAGFAQAFWLLSSNDMSYQFGTVSQSFLTTFLFMLGQNVDADFSGASSPFVGTILLVVFLILMMILMLNLLIALMGDIFTSVRSKGDALWRKEQAAIILEQKFLYDGDTSIPKHLLVLKYSSEVTSVSLDYPKLLKDFVESSDVKSFTPFDVEDETVKRKSV
jgi:hypothetical protein